MFLRVSLNTKVFLNYFNFYNFFFNKFTLIRLMFTYNLISKKVVKSLLLTLHNYTSFLQKLSLNFNKNYWRDSIYCSRSVVKFYEPAKYGTLNKALGFNRFIVFSRLDFKPVSGVYGLKNIKLFSYFILISYLLLTNKYSTALCLKLFKLCLYIFLKTRKVIKLR